MGGLFAKHKKPASRVTEQDKAVLQLKQQRDKIKQYQRRIKGVLEKDREMARKLLQENKRDRAKILLKKKRYLEQLTEKTDNQLDGIEQMVQDIEFSQVQVEVLKNLEKGNAALKKLHDVFSMSDVEKIMDETREGIEKQQEIDDLLSGNLTEDDLAAVEDELNEIMKANLPEVENLPEVPTEEPTLPDIPQGEPTAVCALFSRAYSYFVTVDAHAEECFFEKVQAGTKMGLTFEVAEGGFLDIDVKIYSPDGNLIYEGDRESNGKFAFAADKEGVYRYCFSNKMSTMTPKIVMFSMDVGEKPADAKEED
ncbi:hypothetical protein QYM36_008693, partial [Artemia franciscana]